MKEITVTWTENDYLLFCYSIGIASGSMKKNGFDRDYNRMMALFEKTKTQASPQLDKK